MVYWRQPEDDTSRQSMSFLRFSTPSAPAGKLSVTFDDGGTRAEALVGLLNHPILWGSKGKVNQGCFQVATSRDFAAS
jgi:hypothetical protein